MKRTTAWVSLAVAALIVSCTACSVMYTEDDKALLESMKESRNISAVPAPVPAPAPAPAPKPAAAPSKPAPVATSDRAKASATIERIEISGSAKSSARPKNGHVEVPASKIYAPRDLAAPVETADDAMKSWPFFGQLTKSDIAFNTPEQMQLGKDAEMQLIIDPTKTSEEIKSAITAEGARVGATVQVSKIVVAKLLAPDFEVVEFVNKGRQAIDFSGPTEWKWLITPKEEGSHKVHLTISAVIEVGPDRAERLIKTFDREIVVIVTPADRVKGIVEKHWEWAFSSLLVPLGIWLWRRYRGKKDEA